MAKYITRTIIEYNTEVRFVKDGQLDICKLEGVVGKKGSKEAPYFSLRK